MADWSLVPRIPGVVPVISTSTLNNMAAIATPGTLASATWPTGSLAIYVPFRISTPMQVKVLWLANGTAVSGNVDMGIYAPDGTRLVNKGSTAQAGTTAIQTLDITDTQLAPGVFYLALAIDNTTGTTARFAPGQAGFCAFLGIAQQASAFALPATATFASMASAYVPIMGLADRTFV